jgi:1-carboxybiuret hydrolase subunit AtzG-like protein
MPAIPPPQALTLDDETLARFVEASAALQRLAIAPEWRAAVTAHLKATAAAADFVLAFPLPDEAEPAPVFTA